MNFEPATVITIITRTAAPLLLKKAQRSEIVIEIFKQLKIEPAQPPADFDAVYAYALVEFAIDETGEPCQPEEILNLFKERYIKYTFWKSFNSEDSENNFIQAVDKFVDEFALGDDIKSANIDVRYKSKDFYLTFINVAKRTRNPADVIRDQQQDKQINEIKQWIINANLPEPPAPETKAKLSSYLLEFEPLIKEKIRSFCGRKFVFEAFEQFLSNHPNGYFTVIGDAGMGKSAIAAKYVYDHQAICYFNSFAEGRTSPEQFLESIRKQLISRYNLQNAEDADLVNLLTQVSHNKKTDGERLIIVVDALDEVEQKSGGNLLNLPTTLPDNIYFILTRRTHTPAQKRLFVSPGTPVKELDLISEYADLSREDIKEYICFSLNDNSCEYKDGLNKWIQDRRENITQSVFVEQIVDKSENNFMYLRFVLPDIANGKCDDLNLRELPDGLQQYYQTHWERMGMDSREMRQNAIILYVLVEAGKPISCETIASITNQNEYEVLEVLEEWIQFLRQQTIKGEGCYSMYHKSFTDFLRDKPPVKKYSVKLQDIQRLISDENDRMWEELEKEEEEDE